MRVPNRLVTERKEKDKTVSVASVDKIDEGRGTLSFFLRITNWHKFGGRKIVGENSNAKL